MTTHSTRAGCASAIGLHGAYYGGNFGDVLIANVMARELRARTTVPVIAPLSTDSFRAASGLANTVNGEQWTGGVGVYGPGGYFGERPLNKARWHVRFNTYHRRFHYLTQRHRIPTGIFATGFGPLSCAFSRALLRGIAERTSVIYVRDEESAEFLTDIGGRIPQPLIVPDIAFLLRPQPETALGFAANPPFDDNRIKIGLHIQGISMRSKFHLDQLCEALTLTIAQQAEVEFLLLTDGPTAQPPSSLLQLVSKHHNIRIVPYSTPATLVSNLQHLSAVFTTKLHVGICSMALGVPAFAAYLHPKVLRLFRQLDIPERCTPIAEATFEWLSASIEGVTSGTIRVPVERIVAARAGIATALDGFIASFSGLRP